MAPDLPHLFARLSELVHAAGYAPEDLVLIPRSEIDRRETAAFTAGWAEAMSEELPRIRREYEKRVADAYAAGAGGRGGDAAARRTSGEGGGGGGGAKVIRLPFATLLEPSPLVVETEGRMRRAQEILDRRTEPVHGQAADPDTGAAAGQPRPHEHEPEDPREPQEPQEPQKPREPQEPPGGGAVEPAPPPARPLARERRAAPASRKVVRRNGRPIVPPLGSIPVQSRPQGTPAELPADGPGAAGEPGGPGEQGAPSLADRARALAQDLEARVGAGRPEAPENGR
ncbi:hypothetical protein [Streptomyces sp. NPDC058412]|uniref:hypothetical protein n=1 Tax=Streptomyces sp. NPDC058412 TaxID=3346486 RepID=UPI0036498B59